MYRRSPFVRARGLDPMMFGTGALAILASALTAVIAFVVLGEAMPALTDIGLWRFLTDPSWHPGSGEYAETFRYFKLD